MIWTRSGTAWDTHSTNTLQQRQRVSRRRTYQIPVPFWTAPESLDSAHTAPWWAPQHRVTHLQTQPNPLTITGNCDLWEKLGKVKWTGNHITTAFHEGRSAHRGSSQKAGTEPQVQKAPPVPGLFLQCAQHTEQPGGTVEEVISTFTSPLVSRWQGDVCLFYCWQRIEICVQQMLLNRPQRLTSNITSYRLKCKNRPNIFNTLSPKPVIINHIA